MSDDKPLMANIKPFGLRMQPELKARVQAAADANERSLNSEIVATLEEKYPAPSNIYISISGTLKLCVLHWLENIGEWEYIDGANWNAFKSFGWVSETFIPLNGVDSGINYFIVVVEDKDKYVVNFFASKYLIAEDGSIQDLGYQGLSDKEIMEYRSLVKIKDRNEIQTDRFRQIQEKMYLFEIPPLESIPKLIEKLHYTIKPGSAAEGFLQKYYKL